jgi:hypothetical protein
MTAAGPLTNFGLPLVVRVPAAALVVALGARTNRAWTVPVAVVLAIPSIFVATFSVLVAVPWVGHAVPASPTGLPNLQSGQTRTMRSVGQPSGSRGL